MVWIVVVLCFSVEIDDGVDFLWVEDNSVVLQLGSFCNFI